MTATIARLVLAMLLLPATGAVFVVGFAMVLRSGGPPTTADLLMLWTIVYVFVFTYWVLLWRPVVQWTRVRILRTVLTTVICLVAGAIFGATFFVVNPHIPIPLVILSGGGVVPILWILSTVIVWRENPVERLARLSAMSLTGVLCPLCGYNLTGLRETRCPECGSSFTLDQLVATQTGSEERTLEL